MKKLLLLNLLFLTSCGLMRTFKLIDAYDAESISSQPFYEEMDFELIKGFIIIEAAIEGKKGKFIFDTGGGNQLDDDFAKGLTIQKIGKIKNVDSNGHKKYIPYGTVKSLTIGKTKFYDSVISISDVEALNKVACLNVVGIIGVNAMNKCVWQINYQIKIIIIEI